MAEKCGSISDREMFSRRRFSLFNLKRGLWIISICAFLCRFWLEQMVTAEMNLSRSQAVLKPYCYLIAARFHRWNHILIASLNEFLSKSSRSSVSFIRDESFYACQKMCIEEGCFIERYRLCQSITYEMEIIKVFYNRDICQPSQVGSFPFRVQTDKFPYIWWNALLAA